MSYIFTSWSLELFSLTMESMQLSFLTLSAFFFSLLPAALCHLFHQKLFKCSAGRCRWVYNNHYRLRCILCCSCVNLLLSERIYAAVTGTWIGLCWTLWCCSKRIGTSIYMPASFRQALLSLAMLQALHFSFFSFPNLYLRSGKKKWYRHLQLIFPCFQLFFLKPRQLNTTYM